MQIDNFLKNRTQFIRYFYDHAVSPFKGILIAIEKEEEPYVPPYSEDPEPPFLEEWILPSGGIPYQRGTLIYNQEISLDRKVANIVENISKTCARMTVHLWL